MTRKCDCLNECGDDSRVAAGTVAKCDRYDQVQHDMWQRRTAAALQNCMTLAARDVLQERRRQIEVEHWSPEHDDEHDDGALARAAICYADVGNSLTQEQHDAMWPWSTISWRPKDRRQNLVRAAALLLAEIERLDRSQPANVEVNG